ncbi:MAG: tRNA/rRNA methyltransferase [Verrucomicrobiales bacterium]|jgi:tRNA/rRNA methyltransferase
MPDSPPVIILVNTQLGENIGMCARAMLNCGLDELRLVNPRDGWPNPAAIATAADADSVIEGVVCFDSVDEAVSDCHRVLATTARNRRLNIPGLDLADAVAEIRRPASGDDSARIGVLFGPEASGLDNESLARADRLIHIPTNPEFSSVNLAQAVLLFSWEWWRTNESAVSVGSDQAPAEKSETNAFLSRLEVELEASGFFLTPELRPDTMRNLRALFTRNNLSSDEIRMLHGVLTALKKRGEIPA